MIFRILSRLKYLLKARHKGGHGIHSPFLFRLITEVIEDRKNNPEYEIIERLHNRAFEILPKNIGASFPKINHQADWSLLKLSTLYNKAELPAKYRKMVVRLIYEFEPSAIIHFGPALGVNLAAMAIANNFRPVYQISGDPAYDIFAAELLSDSMIPNVCFLSENEVPPIQPSFILVNSPDNPGKLRKVVQQCLRRHVDNDVLILRGIHQSVEMETIWRELIGNKIVRVSIDQFEIGLVLFRKGLQKEDFIHRF